MEALKFKGGGSNIGTGEEADWIAVEEQKYAGEEQVGLNPREQTGGGRAPQKQNRCCCCGGYGAKIEWLINDCVDKGRAAGNGE